MKFEFLIPNRPVSLQTKNRKNLQRWKSYVQEEAKKTWAGQTSSNQDLFLCLVFVYDEDPIDVDNIIKPIQDALVGLVYDDDVRIVDVESHRRPRTTAIDPQKCPLLLFREWFSENEFVYVRVSESRDLESFL